MVPLTNIEVPNLSVVRALICAGQVDPIIRVTSAQRLAALLEHSGAEVSLEVQPSGHELSAADVVAAQKWISRAD